MKSVTRIVAAICLVLSSSTVFAAEFPHFFQGVRPLGMGGAFTAVADDENALFYNPAGLDKVERWGMGLINPIIEVSESGVDFYSDLSDTDTDQTSEVTDLLRDYMGENMRVRAALFPHVVMPNFAIGLLAQEQLNLKVDDPAWPKVNVQSTATGSGHIGYGTGFFEDKVRIGLGAKFIKASVLDETYTSTDISDPNFDTTVEDALYDGTGFGFDAGIIATAPVLFNPSLGVMVQNIGDIDLGDAGVIPQQVNLGVSLSEKFGEGDWFTLTGAADWIDVTEAIEQEDDLNKRLHFGVEASMPVLSVRGGLYQGYASFGATVDLKLFKIDYANYAAEVGSYSGINEDRRQVVQVSLGW